MLKRRTQKLTRKAKTRCEAIQDGTLVIPLHKCVTFYSELVRKEVAAKIKQTKQGVKQTTEIVEALMKRANEAYKANKGKHFDFFDGVNY